MLPAGSERLQFLKAIHDLGFEAAPNLLKVISGDDPELSLWAANLLHRVLRPLPLGTSVHNRWHSLEEIARILERQSEDTQLLPEARQIAAAAFARLKERR